jgi:hypothetical protein
MYRTGAPFKLTVVSWPVPWPLAAVLQLTPSALVVTV